MGFPYDLYEVKNDFYLKYGNESKAKIDDLYNKSRSKVMYTI